MNLSQFLSLNYWFEVTPVGEFQYLDFLTWVFVAVFVLAIVLQLSARFVAMNSVLRRFVRRLPGGFYLMSIIGAFLLFARFQRAPYLGMRVLLLLDFVLFAVWLIVLLVRFLKNYKRDMTAFLKRKENKKETKKNKRKQKA